MSKRISIKAESRNAVLECPFTQNNQPVEFKGMPEEIAEATLLRGFQIDLDNLLNENSIFSRVYYKTYVPHSII